MSHFNLNSKLIDKFTLFNLYSVKIGKISIKLFGDYHDLDLAGPASRRDRAIHSYSFLRSEYHFYPLFLRAVQTFRSTPVWTYGLSSSSYSLPRRCVYNKTIENYLGRINFLFSVGRCVIS